MQFQKRKVQFQTQKIDQFAFFAKWSLVGLLIELFSYFLN
nr:MAG TPA: hypothetical protein [Caudoviricetes sp.]